MKYPKILTKFGLRHVFPMYCEAFITLLDGDLILFIANGIFQVSYKKTADTKSHLLKLFSEY